MKSDVGSNNKTEPDELDFSLPGPIADIAENCVKYQLCNREICYSGTKKSDIFTKAFVKVSVMVEKAKLILGFEHDPQMPKCIADYLEDHIG